MDTILSALKSIGSFLYGVFKALRGEHNTPEMKARAQSQDDINRQSQIEQDVARKDTEAIRKDIAE